MCKLFMLKLTRRLIVLKPIPHIKAETHPGSPNEVPELGPSQSYLNALDRSLESSILETPSHSLPHISPHPHGSASTHPLPSIPTISPPPLVLSGAGKEAAELAAWFRTDKREGSSRPLLPSLSHC